MEEKKCPVCSEVYLSKKKSQICCSSPCNSRKQWIKTMYNIEPSEVNRLYELQDGQCNICRIEIDVREMGFNNKNKGCIDHYEINGIKKVRGLLCLQCNKGIGCLNHNPELIKAAIEYLKPFDESHGLKSTPRGKKNKILGDLNEK